MRSILTIFVMFALAACGGGGGSGSQTGMMMPTPTDPMPQTQLSVGAGLSVGESPSYATTAADKRLALLANPSNRFRAYTATVDRDYTQTDGHPNASARITNRFSIASVRSDGNYGMRVTYSDKRGADPTQFEAHFPVTSLANAAFYVEYEDLGYWLWAASRTPFRGDNYGGHDGYSTFIGSARGSDRMLAVYGVETPSAALPNGTATYSGQSTGYAEMYDNSIGNVSRTAGRTQLFFDVTLDVDFAKNSLTGRLDATEIRRPGDDAAMPYTGTGFDISNGAIVDGQFTASLTGTDTNADRPLADSLRGYAGNGVGAFYGPAAEEAGAVFTAERNMGGVHRVMIGTMHFGKDGN